MLLSDCSTSTSASISTNAPQPCSPIVSVGGATDAIGANASARTPRPASSIASLATTSLPPLPAKATLAPAASADSCIPAISTFGCSASKFLEPSKQSKSSKLSLNGKNAKSSKSSKGNRNAKSNKSLTNTDPASKIATDATTTSTGTCPNSTTSTDSVPAPKRRKSACPTRSVSASLKPIDRIELGIIKLDVYSTYLQNPRALLTMGVVHSSSVASHRSSQLLCARNNASAHEAMDEPDVNPATARANLAFARASEAAAAAAAAAGASGSFGGLVRTGVMAPYGSASCSTKTSSDSCYSAPSSGGHAHKKHKSANSKESANPEHFKTDEEIRLELLGSKGAIDMTGFRDTSRAPPVFWKKGGLLYIRSDTPGYDLLTPEEITICSTLRVLPEQYMHIKEVILTQAERRGPFKKRDAKAWFRIDVNKTAIIFDWFRALGWIPDDAEWERRFRQHRASARSEKSTTAKTSEKNIGTAAANNAGAMDIDSPRSFESSNLNSSHGGLPALISASSSFDSTVTIASSLTGGDSNVAHSREP
eukprot:jgi/Hompol1/5173/HPOL_004201-RA